MKTFALFILLGLPSLMVGQNTFVNKAIVSGPIQQTAPLTGALIDEILTLAAPQFGYEVDDFIRMYHNCGCITVSQVGPSTYLVTYGGIGILIVIDGSRIDNSGGGTYDGGNTHSRKR